jgi:hypothetical protein
MYLRCPSLKPLNPPSARATNKLEILAPFAALAGLVAAVSAVVVVKRRRD